jgi:hypothetical protein
MSRLVIVVPLREDAYEEARRLLDAGPPFQLEQTRFDRHEVHLTQREVVFVFDAPGEPAALRLPGEDPALWRVAAAWRKLIAGTPRKAETVFSWRRPVDGDLSYGSAAGPGYSEGGDLYVP